MTGTLECWVFDCAFPRVDGVHCAKHCGVPYRPSQPVAVPRERARMGSVQEMVLTLLDECGKPMRLGQIAKRCDVGLSPAHKALNALAGHGRVRKLDIGLYEAVSS